MFRKIVANISNNYFEYALYLLIISLFFGNAVLSIAYVTFFALSIPQIYSNFKIKEFFRDKYLVSYSLYFIINFIIICILFKNFEEIFRVEKLLPFLIFPIIFFSAKNTFINKISFSKIAKVFVFSALISFGLSLIYGLFRMFFEGKTINPIYITYNHLTDLVGVQPIYLSVFYLFAIVFCVDLVKLEQNKKKIYIYICFSLFFAIILLSSRTTLLLSIIVVFLKLLKGAFNKKIIVIFIFSVFTIGALVTLSIPTLKNRVINFNQNVSSYSGSSLRFKIWKNAFEVYKESPVIGHGIYNSQDILMNQYKKVNFRRAYLNKLNSHNQYIQALIDTGVIGLVTLASMFVIPLIHFKRYSCNFCLFLFVIAISLIPESFFLRQYGILFYCLFGLLFYVYDKDRMN